MSERRHRKAEHTEEWEQTSPLSARHIAGVMLAEKSGVECARGRYLWDFTLVISPISRHPKSAYASQGLWRGLTSGHHFFRLFAAGFMFAEAMIRTEERRC